MKEEIKPEEPEYDPVEAAQSLSRALQWITSPRGGNNFYGRILNNVGRSAQEGLGTCSVVLTHRGKFSLMWDPRWFVSLDEPFRLCVLVHEAAHLAFSHLERTVRMTRHITSKWKLRKLQEIMNVAADMAVNDVSVRPMLDHSRYRFQEYRDHFILPEQRKYPKNQTFEQYYRLLMEDLQKHGFDMNSLEEPKPPEPGQGKKKGKKQQRSQGGGGGNNSQNTPGTSQGQQPQNGEGAGQPGTGAGGGGGGGSQPNEDYPGWFQDLLNKSHAPVMWLEDFSDLSEAEVDRAISTADRETKRIVRSAIKQTREKGRGTIPAKLMQQLEALMEEPKVPWTEVLRSMAKSRISSKLSDSVVCPNIALLNTPGIAPYPGYQKNFSYNIMACVDTSGSVSDSEFLEFMNEIRAIVSETDGVQVYIVMFDAAIQSVEKMTDSDEIKLREGLSRAGYGGTSFSPPLKYASGKDEEEDWVQELRDDPSIPRLETLDLTIMFTDGYAPVDGVADVYKPGCPVMWIISESGKIHDLMEPLVIQIES